MRLAIIFTLGLLLPQPRSSGYVRFNEEIIGLRAENNNKTKFVRLSIWVGEEGSSTKRPTVWYDLAPLGGVELCCTANDGAFLAGPLYWECECEVKIKKRLRPKNPS